MLEDSQSPRYSVPRTRRTYAPQFKAELIAACLQPGASLASTVRAHGMNANVLHRWLKEHSLGQHRIACDTAHAPGQPAGSKNCCRIAGRLREPDQYIARPAAVNMGSSRCYRISAER
ncbi:transposase [Acidovorax sp. CCYZU-2555]|uniref:transposase n=1 Tax=Acidovorax sp. CCYZU-2555 TaxID=2835042 RepID=UPI001BD0F5C1|nr:transposase [Acidovorax sp. CCYZU-2555]MBS7778964.1 transposase [Acidovorax sp. CCYZU-2555]